MKDSFFQLDYENKSKRNLGTFSTTTMPEESKEIFSRFACVNAVDGFAYPEVNQMVTQCADFLLKLFHAPKASQYHCYPTSGSSEAIFLAMLLQKNAWIKSSAQKEGRVRANIIVGQSCHVAFLSAAKALDIHVNKIPFKRNHTDWCLDTMAEKIDRNTIGVVCTLGGPTNLAMDDVAQIHQVLDNFENQTKYRIPIHVDAASGGFVAPFLYPDFAWDFRLPRVKSINVSSHKFGLVYPSLGWLCVDDELSDESMFQTNGYLGKVFKRLPLQFSHSAAHIAVQTHHIGELNWQGYKNIMLDLNQKSEYLKKIFDEFKNASFTFSDHALSLPGIIIQGEQKALTHLSVALADAGWHLPVFKTEEKGYCARIVIRYGMDSALFESLTDHIKPILPGVIQVEGLLGHHR